MDESAIGIRIVDTDGKTIYANRAILNIYGYDSIENSRRLLLRNAIPGELRRTPDEKRKKAAR